MWYGQNMSGRQTPWAVGDLVRYDDGPSALMRITSVRQMGPDERGISCSIRYYGRGFHSEQTCTGRYHGQCREPSQVDIVKWLEAHDENDQWVRGVW